MSFPQNSKQQKILILLGRLATAGVSFERSDEGRLNKKIHFYGGGSGRLSVKKNIARRMNDKVNMEEIFIKGADGEDIIRTLVEVGFFKEHYGLLFVPEEELFSLVGMKKPRQETMEQRT